MPAVQQNHKTPEENFLQSVDKALNSISNAVGSLSLKTVRKDGNNVIIDKMESNTIYVCSAQINSLKISKYPDGNFISTIIFSTATSGPIVVDFPKGTRFVGSAPYEFFPAENWELNIQNGRVAGSQIF